MYCHKFTNIPFFSEEKKSQTPTLQTRFFRQLKEDKDETKFSATSNKDNEACVDKAASVWEIWDVKKNLYFEVIL